eukprot:CAMPEP_0204869942 /NCGR_PEP_ID=MMETSP1348-20121228/31053_1 /ASSEMBLY_ACC=CAM_ASM_000700 /TAXON_ID=215587 /ORGANISM="Aplanochytrium stocchinoi, Strain GSBS06" /LENGTH=42 /DNA_ID= /DNA_START= /DNA_END= /DNA_ORIENTATION=
MDPPYGCLTLPDGTLNMKDTQQGVDEEKYPPPPAQAPDPPET